MNKVMERAMLHASKCRNLIAQAMPKRVVCKENEPKVEEPPVPIGYRRCKCCKGVKPIDGFPLNHNYRRYVCIDCYRAHARERQREIRERKKAIKKLTK